MESMRQAGKAEVDDGINFKWAPGRFYCEKPASYNRGNGFGDYIRLSPGLDCDDGGGSLLTGNLCDEQHIGYVLAGWSLYWGDFRRAGFCCFAENTGNAVLYCHNF